MARGASPCRGTSRRCRCRPTRPSSTRSSGSGSACANASSRIACSTATRPCSMLPATPGTPSPRRPAGSPGSPPTLICSDQNFGELVSVEISASDRQLSARHHHTSLGYGVVGLGDRAISGEAAAQQGAATGSFLTLAVICWLENGPSGYFDGV